MQLKYIFIGIAGLLYGTATAQEVLTPQQAIEIALKNNYDVQLAKNRWDIAALNNTPGNAAMLPRLNATLTDNASLTNVNQEFANAPEINRTNVTGNNLNASVNLSWTLFDGMRMFATKGRLKRLEQIGELNYRDTLQTTVAQVLNAYYDIVSAQKQLDAINDNISISNERVKLAQTRFDVGQAAKTELLQARVDLNASKSAAITQQKLIDQKKAELNRILSRNADAEFNVQDTIPLQGEQDIAMPADIENKNFQLQAANKNIEVARFARKEVFSGFLPNLGVFGAYGFTRTQSSAGFSLYNQNYGLSGGFTLSIPLFNGLNTINQYKIAGIQLVNSQYTFEKARIQVKINYYRALKEYTAAREQLALEQDNIQLADENQRIALERFKLAQSTTLELREAQRSYIEAQTRLVTARYNTKVAETELLRLQGSLVK